MSDRRAVAFGTALSALSAVLATLSFGPFHIWWLVFVAFVPMVVAQHVVLPRRWSGLAFAVGIGGFVAGYMVPLLDPTFAWWMRLIPVLLVVPFFGFGLADRRFHERTHYRYLVLATPLAWASIDFLRGWFPATGTNASLPYAVFEHPTLLQPISVTGLVGLNVVILLVNWTIATVVIARLRPDTRRTTTSATIVAVAMVVVIWCGAGVAMMRRPPAPVRVAAIQPGTRSADDDEYARNVAQTRQAAAAGAQLIVWREMTLPFDATSERGEPLRALARETNAYLVVGYAIETRHSLRNEAITIAPDGTVLGTYTKQHPALMFAGDAKATPGREFPVHRASFGGLATIICFDLDFTDTSRGMARNGAQIVAVPSLDPRGIATKHYPLLVLRAVENRLAMVKAESEYASAVIDPYGRIVKRAVSRQSVRATVIADVPLGSGKSPFVTFGDTVSLVVVAGTVVFYAVALRRWRGRDATT